MTLNCNSQKFWLQRNLKSVDPVPLFCAWKNYYSEWINIQDRVVTSRFSREIGPLEDTHIYGERNGGDLL